MGADAKLLALFAGLHLLSMGLAGALLVMFMRSDTASVWRPPEDDGGGGGSDRPGPPRPAGPGGGGVPLPDASPARVRLREPARLADLLPAASRRPAHGPRRQPQRPATPAS